MQEDIPTRIVILGGGFAGISAAMELERSTRGDPAIEVHLVNNENYFVFQPLLPEVVSCGIEPGHILNPIRQLCRHVHFHCATVRDIDRDRRLITMISRDERRPRTLPYDHLIWCLGLKMDLTRVPGMAEHGFPIKTMGDAFHLRNHVLRNLEEADLEPDEAERRRVLSVVAVGGGFSGVETVAAINDMIKAVLPFYPRAKATGHSIRLVHSGERVLEELEPALGGFAQQKLQSRGVELRLNTMVTEATAGGVTLSSGETIPAGTVICTVGNGAHPLIDKMKLPQERGRLLVDDYMRVCESDHLWAVGDAALVPDIKRGGHCPPTAQYAMRQGKQCARNVLAAIRGTALKPSRFGGFGQLAVVGCHSAVGRILGVKISGLLAWFLWRFVYLAKIPGLRCKLRIGLDWLLEPFLSRDITMFETHRTDHLQRAHYRSGEVIVKQGEPGDRFYLVQCGQVEIVQQDDGLPERRLGVRAAGDSFGELALLRDAPRTATVRCLTAVDVVVFTRQDFMTVFGSSTIFRNHIEQEVATHSPTRSEPT